MSIHRHAKQAYKHQLKKDFLENKYLPQTVDGLLEYLFDQDIHYNGYIVYQYKESCDKSTVGQRLNRLWAVPCWWLVAPFKWLFTGSSGVNQHTKLGKWLAKVTGL